MLWVVKGFGVYRVDAFGLGVYGFRVTCMRGFQS